MVVIALLVGVLVLGLVLGPQLWIKWTMKKHAVTRPDFPGTGGELARHLLDGAGLQHVKLEQVGHLQDHYSPDELAVRLSDENFNRKSVTAIAVAAHEVAHAVQHQDGYRPLLIRQKLVKRIAPLQMIGTSLLLLTPIIFTVIKSPVVLIAEVALALAIMASGFVIHLFTLPTEFDASFKKALPVLEDYLRPEDMPAARSVLRAAAFTYVASALMSLLNILRMFRRF